MGGKFDYMMMQLSDPTIGPPAINGGKVPGGLASEPGYAGLGGQFDTAAWSSPDVAGGGKGGGFVVSTDDLRNYAAKIKALADRLNGTLTSWQQSVSGVPSAVAPSAGFQWPQADQLAGAIQKTHEGVSQFVTDLVNAHHDMAQRLTGNAENYDAAEQTNAQMAQSGRAKAIQNALNLSSSSASSVTQVGQNGLNITDPTAQKVGMINKLINMNGGNQPTWNSPPFNITANAPYSGGGAPKVTSQQLIDKLNATDPGVVSSASEAYKPLNAQLATVTGYLSTYAQNLAGVWEGPNAVTAVSQLQQLHQTATALQSNGLSAQQTLGWYGQVLSAYKANPPKPAPVSVPSPQTNLLAHNTAVAQQNANNQAADQAAQTYLASLNTHIQTAYLNMPPQLNKNLPPPIKKTPSPSLSGGSGGPGGLSGGSMAGGGSPGGGLGPGGGSGAPPVSGVPPVGSGPGAGGSPPPGGSGSAGGGTPPPTLSGIPPTGSPPVNTVPPVSTLPPPGTPGGGPGGPGTPGMPGVPTMPGLPGTGPGSPDNSGIPGEGDPPGTGPLGPDPAVSVPGATGVSGNGGGGDPAAVDGVGPDGVSVAGESPGGFGMPGMGGFGGGGGGMGSGQGRTRQAWESEDQGLWDPAEEGLGGAPLVSSDGMIAADGLPGDFGGAGIAGFGPGGMDASGGFGANGGFGGADGAGGFPGGAGGSGAAGEEAGGFPMMGGGAGGRRDGSDRQRQAWMLEDPDIWGEDADRRVPPVIG